MRRILSEDKAGEVFRFSPRPNRAAEIDWRHWGTKAFEEAEREGKLVLLSISAVWCHWCHVMDETTYSDPSVIELINKDFVPVRVDSDKRPDINKRYNQGGWPTTAFLIYTGTTLAGLTYAPPEQLLTMLGKLTGLYRQNRSRIEADASLSAIEEREAVASLSTASGSLDGGIIPSVEAAILEGWDKGFGGLGEGQKFPQPATIEFAMARFAETGHDAMRAFAVSTLDGMMNGGLMDTVEGGFFRYSTRSDWSVPHYEKMLTDNAGLVEAYLKAAVLMGNGKYKEAARSAIDYALLNLLEEEQRGFFGSQDADEEYYSHSMEGRERLEKPAVDRTIYTDSTSRMISALALASFALDDPGLLAIAERCADFLWREGFRHGLGACHYVLLGEPRLFDEPADQVWMLRAMEDLYQATGNPAYLERAIEIADLVIQRYSSPEGWITEAVPPVDPEAEEEEEGAALSDIPPVIPDIEVNGVAARALLTLEALAPDRGYAEAGGRVLVSLSGRAERFSYFASEFAMAADAHQKGILEIRINPDAMPEARAAMLSEAVTAFSPRKAIRPETIEDYMPGEDAEAGPPAVVCSPGECRPAFEPGDVREALGALQREQG